MCTEYQNSVDNIKKIKTAVTEITKNDRRKKARETEREREKLHNRG